MRLLEWLREAKGLLEKWVDSLPDRIDRFTADLRDVLNDREAK